MGWTRTGPPVSGLPSIDSLCFGAHLGNGGCHAGKIFADRHVVSLAARWGAVPRAGAGVEVGTSTADTERSKHNCSPVFCIFATASSAAAAGQMETHGRTT